MRIFETHKMRLKMRMVWALGMRIFETHFMHMECISAERLRKRIKFKYFIETKLNFIRSVEFTQLRIGNCLVTLKQI